jgi:hypothetical protein
MAFVTTKDGVWPRRSIAMTRNPCARKNSIWLSQSSALNGQPWWNTDLHNAVHVGHSTGGGQVARYVAKYGQPQGRVAKP